MPASREPVSLLAVDRAVSEFRRGRPVALRGAGGDAALTLASEAATAEGLAELARLARAAPAVVLTARRAQVLGFADESAAVVLRPRDPLSAEAVRDLADPLSGVACLDAGRFTVETAAAHGCESAAVGLAKVARLLPAALVARIADPDADDLAAWAARHDLLLVDGGDIFQYEYTSARRLRRVSEARVPLMGAENTRILAFRPVDGGLEHLAVVVGEPDPAQPVLTRLHSECFTGDLLGSLRCDCGEQLRAAIEAIGRAGSGVLLYLAQEGRGIGLVNKLRAYTLQDRGLDTLDANEQLGFDADERVYAPAAQMLKNLGLRQVRLLTNNPNKVADLESHGITVMERVPHAFPSNKHNESYLQTKKAKGGHLF
jgi:GTP cyclohydrolase II